MERSILLLLLLVIIIIKLLLLLLNCYHRMPITSCCILLFVMCLADIMEPSSLNVQFVNETDKIVAASNGWEAGHDSANSDDGAGASAAAALPADYCGGSVSSANNRQRTKTRPPPGKKTMGRVKINMEYIKNKVKRYTTFSKRKTGIMKKVWYVLLYTQRADEQYLLAVPIVYYYSALSPHLPR